MMSILLSLLMVLGQSASSEAGSDATTTVPAPYGEKENSDDVSVTRTSRYLTMRDGIRIAIDVYLPEGLKDGETLPTLLHQTRYWRALDYRWPVNMLKGKAPRGIIGKLALRFLTKGYAWISVDVRGSGASFGNRRFSHSPEEMKDGAEVVDWIVQQPWSNGRVGSIGMSYGGASAELLLANKHPAVKAAAPLFSGFDLYPEIAFPGGIHLTWFTQTWSHINRQLDANIAPFGRWFTPLFVRGVMPVDEDPERSLLYAAIQGHANNWDPHHEALGIVFRDDAPPSITVPNIDALSSFTFLEDVAASGAAVYSYSGWFDGAYHHAAIRRYLTLANPANKLIIGPWDHGGKRNISPLSVGPSQFDHAGELLKFFDYHLKGIDTGIMDEKPIHYFTMGEEQWTAAETWPPKATVVTYYFAPDHRLTTKHTKFADASDSYQVDPTAGTSDQSRWNTLVGRSITDPYPNRAEQDQQLLCYTTPPLDQDIEVTGHPLVTLFVSSTATDGTFFVYLEDVNPDGNVTYVTEGMLRALHQKLSERARPYQDVVPYRPFTRADARPLTPGNVATLVFDLLPTSYVFKKGHRIRVGLAGADQDHFITLPKTPPTLTYYRNRTHPSHIQLPTISRLDS